MDEPTAALSDREIELLFALIARLKADGVAIVYISHRLPGGVRARRPHHRAARRTTRRRRCARPTSRRTSSCA